MLLSYMAKKSPASCPRAAALGEEPAHPLRGPGALRDPWSTLGLCVVASQCHSLKVAFAPAVLVERERSNREHEKGAAGKGEPEQRKGSPRPGARGARAHGSERQHMRPGSEQVQGTQGLGGLRVSPDNSCYLKSYSPFPPYF